jgi:predicted Zn-dependent protease
MLTALAGCGGGGVFGGVNLISIEEEWEMGRQIEAQIAQEMDLVRDQVALNYINNLGQRLVSETELSDLPWEFHIVEDPSINAFNVPGGHVYVHTGLIREADSAGELAGVMGHEIAHGVERHATEQMTQQYGLSVLAALVLGQNPSVMEQIVAQIVGTGAVAKFSRDDEREADGLGVRYMYDAGYNPDGMVSMFQTLLAQRQSSPGALEQFFSTHPLSEERIDNIQAEIDALPPTDQLTMHESGFRTLQQRVGS